MSTASDRNRDQATTGKKLEDLYALIEGMEIAMFTTRRADSQLVSRPMATQTQAEGSDLWFVTDIESEKLDELEHDPRTIGTGPGSGCR
jgi:general stress protein 26